MNNNVKRVVAMVFLLLAALVTQVRAGSCTVYNIDLPVGVTYTSDVFDFGVLNYDCDTLQCVVEPTGATITKVGSISTFQYQLSWTPPASYVNNDVDLSVSVVTQFGQTGPLKYLCIHVLANTPPHILSPPPVLDPGLGASTSFNYPVVVSDPDGQSLTYLVTGLPGATFNGSTLQWTVAAPGSYPVSITTSDGFDSDTQSFTLLIPEPPNPVPVVSADSRAGDIPQGATDTVFIHPDVSGSPLVSTDAAGVSRGQESYSAYGERIDVSGDLAGDSVGFTGHVADADTGLVYMGARYYDPFVGRFLSVDSADFDESNSISFNRYAYANNNPYKYIDPDGRSAITKAVRLILNGGNVAATFADVVQDIGVLTSSSASIGVRAFAAASIGSEFLPISISDVKLIGKGLGKVTKKGGDFFKRTKFTDKVKRQMQQDDFHSFPRSVEGFQDAGKVTKFKGGDGVLRERLEIPGGFKGKEGKFEFIKEPDGTINHRFFRPDGQ